MKLENDDDDDNYDDEDDDDDDVDELFLWDGPPTNSWKLHFQEGPSSEASPL